MNHEIEGKIVITYGNKSITLDSKSPDLSELAKKVLADGTFDLDKITCESDIQNFDKEGFSEVIRESCKDIRQMISSELETYDEIKKQIISDETAKEYYEELKKSLE